MRTIILVISYLALAIGGAARAQEHHHTGAGTSTEPAQNSYAGLQQRAIKALSDQQKADLRAGRGMGLALPAELNGYPGPIAHA